MAYCGRCSQYANVRKKRRAFHKPDEFPLHEPCSWTLSTVKGWLRDMDDMQMVYSLKLKIPDPCGWGRDYDYGSRWFDTDEEDP